MSKKAPHTFKDNFWSKLRVERELTVKELATLCGVNEKIMSTFFTGQCMPDDIIVKDLCEYFGVDFNQGQLEFQHAHAKYRAERSRKLMYSAKKKKIKSEDVCDMAEEVAEVKCADEPITMSIDEVRRMFETRWQYAQKALYGTVDVTTYEAIRALFEVNL